MKSQQPQYQPPEKWTGRNDGSDDEHLRWHQCVTVLHKDQINQIRPGSLVIAGFASDEGVRRNLGRTGAKEGPASLRRSCSNFPVHEKSQFHLCDVGNIVCAETDLESSQESLANLVADIHKHGGRSVLFGGGHEIAWPHFSGLRRAYPDKRIGIINFDAHFDLRESGEAGPTSGTGFRQIAESESDFHYLVLGIQSNSNTRGLFDYAKSRNVKYIEAEQLMSDNRTGILRQVAEFTANVDLIYLSVCMDVFSSAFAPGVSATAYNGIMPDSVFLSLFRQVLGSGKVAGFDIAELNPSLDIDNRTSRLAASLIWEFVAHAGK